MNKIAIIHTTPVTVGSLKKLVCEIIPGSEVINIVDDSILPQLIESDGDISLVEDRLMQYIKITSNLDADIVVSACSSVGEVFNKADKQLDISVTRIDDAMAEMAVNKGERIGVAATLGTTLKPTLDLLKSKADVMGKDVEFEVELIDSAFEKLTNGDQEGHDKILSQRLQELVNKVDLVVLAQASMSRVVNSLPDEKQDKFLTSPRMGIEKVKTILKGD